MINVLTSTVFMCSLFVVINSYVNRIVPTEYIVDLDKVDLLTYMNDNTAYTITFNYQFTNQPTVLITLASLHFEPSESKQKIILSPQKIATKLGVNVIMEFGSSSNVLKIEINYFAFDPGSISYPIYYYEKHIKIYDSWIDSTEKQTSEIKNIQYDVSDTNTNIACFIYSLEGYRVSSNYRVTVTCSKKDSQTIKIQVFNAEPFDGSLKEMWTWINYKVIGVSVLVIVGNVNTQAIKSTLSASSNSDSLLISYVEVHQQNYLFIGLKSFQSVNRFLSFSLSIDNKMVKAGTYVGVAFDYLIVSRKDIQGSYLNQTGSNFYNRTVFFHFLNVRNTSEMSNNLFKIQSGCLVFSSILAGNIVHNQIIFITQIISSIDQKQTSLFLSYSLATRKYNITVDFFITTITKVQINPNNQKGVLFLKNARDSTKTNFNFKINPSFYLITDVITSGNNSIILFEYTKQAILVAQQLIYLSNSGDFSWNQFMLPSINQFITSVGSAKIQICLEGLNQVSSKTQFTQTSNNIQNLQIQIIGPSVYVVMEYINVNIIENQDFYIEYCWDPILLNIIKIGEFKLMTLKQIKNSNRSDIFQLTFINLKDVNSISSSQFDIVQSGISILSSSILNENLILKIQSDQNIVKNNQFSITINSLSDYKVTINNIQTVQRYKQFNSIQYMNNIQIFLYNIGSLTSNNLPKIKLNNRDIRIKQIQITDDNLIHISTQFNNTVDGYQLQIQYVEDDTTIFSQIISFPLIYKFPLMYCVGELNNLSNIYQLLATILQYSYLGMFAISIICSNKLAGVELIFNIQFAFYSFIVIGVNCPWVGLAKIKYVSGINPLFENLKQIQIPYRFTDLGLYSNFNSNVNIMVYIIILCPIIYTILTFFGNKSNSYKTKPRLLKYGNAFIFEIPLTLLLFNSFNVCTSFIIEISYFGISDLSGFIASLSIFGFLPIYGILFFFFRRHFIQYRQQFQTVQKIGRISNQKSTFIRQMYPLILIFQFILTPILLSLPQAQQIALYLVMGLFLIQFIYVLVATPYQHQFDNLRLIFHNVIKIAICILQIVFFNFVKQKTGNVFYLPLVLISLLTIGLLLNGINIIRLSIQWIKKKGVIDHNMKIKQVSKTNKPEIPPSLRPNRNPFWYPKLQFGKFKRPQIQALKKLENKQKQFTIYDNILKEQQPL